MVVTCRHTPTLKDRLAYWGHVVWNHTPDVEPGNRIIRVCLMVDWMDGLLTECPDCIWETLDDGQELHLHHVADDECCD